MNELHWNMLLRLINGESVMPMPTGFIIDSPWLPGWYGIPILDYFSNDELWLKANLKAIDEFPETMFLPGFWSEYGMCTEPSAFGARCIFPQNQFPHLHKIIESPDQVDALAEPHPATDGLLPFALNRLKLAQPHIEAHGHHIRFAVARGPLNIASYLMGMTEFLTAMMLQPDKIHLLLKKITSFLKNWIELQMQTFPTIDGILILDDILGFIGEPEFLEFALPYFKELYGFNVSVKFLHNDASCQVSAPYLPEMGVNLFNMGFSLTLQELKQLTKEKVVLLGNIPPRDVLAAGSPEQIRAAVQNQAVGLTNKTRVLFSCGGGMPPGVTAANLRAFIEAVAAVRS